MEILNTREDWAVRKLGKFAFHEKGKKPKNQKAKPDSIFSIPYIDIEAFEKGIFKSYTDGEKCKFCNEEDFLIVWDGSRSGLVGKGVSGALGSTLVRINFPKIENDFAYYFLKSKYQAINTRAKGSGTPHVDPNILWNYDFPIAPLPEQRAIVAKIEELFSDLDNGIANLKKAQEQLKVYRQAVLKKAFEGELTKEWRAKQTDLPSAEELLEKIKTERENHYQQQLSDWKQEVKEWEENGKKGKKPRKPRKAKELPPLTEEELKDLPELPNGWSFKKIGNITDCIVPNRDKPKSFSGDIKWVTTPDLNEKAININYSKVNIGLSKEEVSKYNARVIPVNSVIMTCVGTLGISSIVERLLVVNQQLHAFLPATYYSPKFLAYYIRSSRGYFEKASTSTTVQYLNKDNCNSLPFPVLFLKEQHQIVQEIESRLSVCDKMEESITESLEKAKALRQSILKKAFEGKLLTKAELQATRQQSDWEPAEKLLERIKGENNKS